MDGSAPACIGMGRSCVGGVRHGAELPRDREHRCAPVLLRCGVSTKDRETRRKRQRRVGGIQGPVPCGRGPNRRKAEEYLPRLLSFAMTFGNLRMVPAGEPENALAIRQTKAHCSAATARPSAFIGGVDASCAPAQPRSGASKMSAQPSTGKASPFADRLAQEATSLRLQAEAMPPGVRRTELLRKATQIDVAGEINNWLTSPGLQAPS